MGLDASLALLGLSPRATIDDANQAYDQYHRMIDMFHKDNDTDPEDCQEDLEFLACAYEKAVSYLSDPDRSMASEDGLGKEPGREDSEQWPPADIHFSLPDDGSLADSSPTNVIDLFSEPRKDAVESAVAIITKRLQEAETALADARKAVEAATVELDTASRRLEKTKKARMEAEIVAEAASSRAILLDIEAQRETEEAIAIAKKVRDKLQKTRQAGKQAKLEVDKARQKIEQFTVAEETAAAETVCAKDRLEKAKNDFKSVTHVIVETRAQLRMFEDYGAHAKRMGVSRTAARNVYEPASRGGDRTGEREKMMADLMEIENTLTGRNKAAGAGHPNHHAPSEAAIDGRERRRHDRLYYPDNARPVFSFEGRDIPVLDLSQSGIRLEPDDRMSQSNLVRGSLLFGDLPSMNVAGRVVHHHGEGLGLRLVTRIGNHILDQERRRLSA